MKKKKRGEWGEKIAVDYLVKKGYHIITRNWHHGHEEIDIIAKDGDMLVIVEVKTRESDAFGNPEDFLSRGQQKRLINAADAYVNEFDLDIDVRFDVIGITVDTKPPQIIHIDDAFYPTL
jgi:putative endonuclease